MSLIQEIAYDVARAKVFGLSRRETQVLQWFAKGLTRVQVASAMDVSAQAIAKYERNIMLKVRHVLDTPPDTAPDRHLIDFGELPTRVSNLLRSMTPLPMYWEELAFVGERMLLQRGLDVKSYNLLAERVAATCLPKYHLPALK